MTGRTDSDMETYFLTWLQASDYSGSTQLIQCLLTRSTNFNIMCLHLDVTGNQTTNLKTQTNNDDVPYTYSQQVWAWSPSLATCTFRLCLRSREKTNQCKYMWPDDSKHCELLNTCTRSASEFHQMQMANMHTCVSLFTCPSGRKVLQSDRIFIIVSHQSCRFIIVSHAANWHMLVIVSDMSPYLQGMSLSMRRILVSSWAQDLKLQAISQASPRLAIQPCSEFPFWHTPPARKCNSNALGTTEFHNRFKWYLHICIFIHPHTHTNAHS